MISKTSLQRAADKHIIQPEQIEPLYQFLSQPDTDIETGREEPLKFIRSFGDVFIALGVILTVVAINMINLSGTQYLIPATGFIVLSEWLVRQRRLALPGIAILLSILYFVNKAIEFNHEQANLLGLAVLSLTSLLYYLRYRMPFSLLPLAAGLVAMVVIYLGMDVLKNPIIFALLGVIIFSIAMLFDAADTKRVSHLSDSAFWLHLLAAPLIVHGAMVSMLLSDQQWIQSLNREILMIIFFSAFFLLALLVDRRALLVSTQLYIIYALTQLLQDQINTGQSLIMYVLMGLGLFVIFFGTYWYLARRIVWGFLAGTPISHYLPDLNQKDSQF